VYVITVVLGGRPEPRRGTAPRAGLGTELRGAV